MSPRYQMLKVQESARYINWHAKKWLETSLQAEEDRHRSSIVCYMRRIESLLQARDQAVTEPWLTLSEIQQRTNDCDVDPTLKP